VLCIVLGTFEVIWKVARAVDETLAAGRELSLAELNFHIQAQRTFRPRKVGSQETGLHWMVEHSIWLAGPASSDPGRWVGAATPVDGHK
jgi:hypothetical protein